MYIIQSFCLAQLFSHYFRQLFSSDLRWHWIGSLPYISALSVLCTLFQICSLFQLCTLCTFCGLGVFYCQSWLILLGWDQIRWSYFGPESPGKNLYSLEQFIRSFPYRASFSHFSSCICSDLHYSFPISCGSNWWYVWISPGSDWISPSYSVSCSTMLLS